MAGDTLGDPFGACDVDAALPFVVGAHEVAHRAHGLRVGRVASVEEGVGGEPLALLAPILARHLAEAFRRDDVRGLATRDGAHRLGARPLVAEPHCDRAVLP